MNDQETRHRLLLEKWLREGLTKEEEAELPPGLLEQARAEVKHKIEQGLAEVGIGNRFAIESRRYHEEPVRTGRGTAR